MNGEFILVGIIFVLIIFVSMYGSSIQYVPYSFSSSKLPLYPYEGFSNDINPLPVDNQKQTDTSFDIHRSEILSGSSLSHESNILDPVSKLPGSASCVGRSSNLSNSLGGICLDPATIQQMKTRGNNFS
jgi:hypothetical protein